MRKLYVYATFLELDIIMAKHYGNYFKKFEISLLKSSDFKIVYIENNIFII